jgi:hypothetical protein
MQTKTILLATFTKPRFEDSITNKLKEKHGIEKEDIFFFDTEYGDRLLTYRLTIQMGERVDVKKDLRKTIQIHKKGKTFFTINALNKLIERENNLEGGNVDYSQYKIEWPKFEDKLILLKKGELDIVSIHKI